MAQQTVLNLDRLTDRPVVVINGAEHRLYTVDLLPPLENYRLRKMLKRIEELSTKEDLTDAEIDELAGPESDETEEVDGETVKVRRGGLLDKATRIILKAPLDVHQKLRDHQRVEIIQLFPVPSLILKYTAAATEKAAEAETEPIPTGSTSAPESPASIPEKAAPSAS